MRVRFFLIAGMIALGLLFGASQCPDGTTPGFDGGVSDGGGRDASVPLERLYTWSISSAFDAAPAGGYPLATAVGPGGRLAVAYFVDTDPPQTYHCVTNLGESDIDDVQLMLARYDGSAWTVDAVEVVHSADAVSVAYDAAGTLQLVYMAGPTTGTYCGVSQLFGRSIGDTGIGSPTLLVADSNTGDACRLMQNACNAGDNAGRFPAMTRLPDGRLLLAFQDTHYNFGQQTDIEGSDLEVLLGTSPLSAGDRQCLDDSSGAGAYSAAFAGPDGRAAVATFVPVTHNFNSAGCLDSPPVEDGTAYNWTRGIYVHQEQEDGSWSAQHLADILVSQRLAGAYSENEGTFVAYSLGGQLAAYHSTDGSSYQSQIIDPIGRNAVSPSAAVDGQGRVLIAYGRCSTAPGSNCQAAQDGVRLAARVDGRWVIEDVVNDVDALDGVEIFLGIDPDTGNPVIMYRNASAQRIMIARGTPL